MYDSLDYDSRCAEIRRMREAQRMMYERLRARAQAEAAEAQADAKQGDAQGAREGDARG